MTDTIHHSIRNRAASQLLLARQWAERINYEFKTLTALDLDGRTKWLDRLEADIKTTIDRNHEDGFKFAINVALTTDVEEHSRKELRFVPYIVDLYQCGAVIKLAVFTREAVQS